MKLTLEQLRQWKQQSVALSTDTMTKRQIENEARVQAWLDAEIAKLEEA